MRVISGTAKGRRLKKVPGDSTRPILDRVKESLFNILWDEVEGSRWLDLFAGTGQVGIEALSRGAAEVVFIDNVKAAIRTIDANLQNTRLANSATVLMTDAFAYLNGKPKRPFDIIYVAPPQYKDIWIQIMQALDERYGDFLTADGIIIVQIDPREYEALSLNNLHLYRDRKYGNTILCFYEIAVA
ncbi:MAG: 16S rRNA (guanine(966)-N(2))-methyltransferase RsmD [Chloroflexi bacterium]|nr:MAG: 16S rRNA (guanine(966)-N(2))-methyltransferase RsmD [Chloroflexota bacterium]